MISLIATKVGFVGDPHLNSTTPASRLDDYPKTTLRKLAEIRRICLERGVPIVILLGDVFHKNAQSQTYVNAVAKELSKWRDQGIKVYSISGNHDLSFEKLESIDKSPLQIFYISGLIEHLTELYLPGVHITGFDYPVKIEKAPDDGLFNVCVNHRFYNYNLSEYSLYDKHIKALGYDLYAMGWSSGPSLE